MNRDRPNFVKLLMLVGVSAATACGGMQIEMRSRDHAGPESDDGSVELRDGTRGRSKSADSRAADAAATSTGDVKADGGTDVASSLPDCPTTVLTNSPNIFKCRAVAGGDTRPTAGSGGTRPTTGSDTPVDKTKPSTPTPGVADLKISPSFYYQFGHTALGTTKTSYDFTVSNAGAVEATALAWSLDAAAPFVVSGSCATPGLTLKTSQSCVVRFSFVPKRVGTASNTAQLKYSDGSAAKTLNVSLAGYGTPADRAYLISSFTTGIYFGCKLIGDDRFPSGNFLTNRGVANASDFSVSIGSPQFTVSGACTESSTILAPGEMCGMTVNYVPTTTGRVDTDMIVTYHNGEETTTLSLHLTGYGAADAAALQACRASL